MHTCQPGSCRISLLAFQAKFSFVFGAFSTFFAHNLHANLPLSVRPKLCPVRSSVHPSVCFVLPIRLSFCSSDHLLSSGLMRVPFTARLPLASWLPACTPHPPPHPYPRNPQLEAHPLHCRRRSGLVQFFFHFLCAVNNFCSVYFFRVGRRRRRCFFQTLIVVACPFAHSSTASSSSASRSCYVSCCCRCCCCFSGVNCTPHVFTPAAKGHPSAYVCACVRVYICGDGSVKLKLSN